MRITKRNRRDINFMPLDMADDPERPRELIIFNITSAWSFRLVETVTDEEALRGRLEMVADIMTTDEEMTGKRVIRDTVERARERWSSVFKAELMEWRLRRGSSD